MLLEIVHPCIHDGIYGMIVLWASCTAKEDVVSVDSLTRENVVSVDNLTRENVVSVASLTRMNVVSVDSLASETVLCGLNCSQRK